MVVGKITYIIIIILLLGLFGSSFLVGIVIGCFTLARMGDIYGRKPIFLIGILIQTITFILMIFARNSMELDLLFLMFGISSGGK